MDKHEAKNETTGVPFCPDRREFGMLALTGALGTAAFLGSAARSSKAMQQGQAGIKLCAQSSAKPTDDQLLFLKQIGAEYVSVGSTPDLRTADGFAQIKKRLCGRGDHRMEHRQLRCP